MNAIFKLKVYDFFTLKMTFVNLQKLFWKLRYKNILFPSKSTSQKSVDKFLAKNIKN